MPKIYRNFVNCEHKKSLDSPRGHYNQYIDLAPQIVEKTVENVENLGIFRIISGIFPVENSKS
jgi:hypothetical protein